VSELLEKWRRFTPARVALGRSGYAAKTRDQLEFALDHARARDAVQEELDVERLAAGLEAEEFEKPLALASAAGHKRDYYLLRPDEGRRLTEQSRRLLVMEPSGPDLALVLGDGLSARATHEYGVALARAIRRELPELTFSRVLLARGARVALSDEIGELLGAPISVILLGERPGLSTSESLGAYLTFDPRRGRSDAERNCVSNIHRQGLGVDAAAWKIAFLVRAALQQGRSGVTLKDTGEVNRLGEEIPT
jgi:ethanolamine ammonia-lyase small subunit